MPNFKANRSFTQKSAHSNNAVCTALNSQKSKAIDEANAHGISTEFAKKYSIHRATLYRWAKSQVEVKAARLTKTFAVDTRRGPSIKYPELEKRFLEWVTDMRSNRSWYVTSECLLIVGGRFKPRLLSERRDCTAVEYLRRFRLRNRISIRRITHRGTKHPSDLEIHIYFSLRIFTSCM